MKDWSKENLHRPAYPINFPIKTDREGEERKYLETCFGRKEKMSREIPEKERRKSKAKTKKKRGIATGIQ